MAGHAAHAAGRGHVGARRPTRGAPGALTVRVDAVAGYGIGMAGQVSAVFLQRIRGGQPLLLRRGRKVAAVLLDPDTYAELEAIADDLLAMEASGWPGRL